MSFLDELKSYFFTKGQTFSKPEVLQLINNVASGSVGQFKVNDPAPVLPQPNQSLELIGTGIGASPSGTYINLKVLGGVSLVIPEPAAAHAIINARAYWNGSYWSPAYNDISLPAIAKIPAWNAQSYNAGDQVNYNGLDWVANEAAAPTNIPGTSSKWQRRLNVSTTTEVAAQIDNATANKANVDDLIATNNLLLQKADQSALNTTDLMVAGKASQTDLMATNAQVAQKANQSALDQTNNDVAARATIAALKALIGSTAESPIFVDTDGNFIIQDALKNIGLILTRLGVLKVGGVEAASLKLAGQNLLLSELTKNADFNLVKTYADLLKTAFNIDAAGNFNVTDGNGFVGMQLTADGLLRIIKLVLSQMQLGTNIITDDPNWLIAFSDVNKNLAWGVTKSGQMIAKSIKVTGTADIPGLNAGVKYPTSYWGGKTVYWIGDSISEGINGPSDAPLKFKYPNQACAQHGATCLNLAVGGSMIRSFRKDGSYAGLSYPSFAYAFTHTIAQKQDFITNYDTYKVNLTGTVPTTLSTDEQAKILACSYENKLLPYLNGNKSMPDIFVLCHGYNDFWNRGSSIETETEFKTAPANRTDRNTFIGSMNFIIDLILQYNPKARIAIMGHYDNTMSVNLGAAQQLIADSWNIPIYKTWERTMFTTARRVPGSAALWAVAPYSSYSANQDTSQDMTLLRTWLPDNIHHHTDPTGKATALFGNLAGSFLNSIY